MKQLIKSIGMAVGGAGLFLGAMVGFARMQGVAWHELPIVGSAFPVPPKIELRPEQPLPQAAATKAAPPKLEAQTASLGVLDVFRIDSPWTAAQIDELVNDLKTSKLDLEKRLADAADREAKLDARAIMLDEQYTVLKDLRREMERWKSELELQAAELESSKKAKTARDDLGWDQVAKLFEKGDAAELSARLKTYAPEEAAKILAKLKPTRAQEILNSLNGDEWKEFAEAYRLHTK